ncbi:hypothetical protein EC973_003023 [Apophysomyces ossiformis]|uniref:Zn(2)-C6 fungal-type domain-containing protein n=1 Tax=Apophysomyces ossiformis TaxID=679940 RepID=A0A8H7BXZ9_9FUNG|nr:hypothetical protein EC973_003023 [Apophysomyces ossiformis]
MVTLTNHVTVPQRYKKRRTRNATACMRCRELKKKCDNAFPSCSRCLDFGANCLYLTYEEYQQSLADKVVELRQELDKMQQHIDDYFNATTLDNLPDVKEEAGGESDETLEFYRLLWRIRLEYEARKEQHKTSYEIQEEPDINRRTLQWHATLGSGRVMIETGIQTYADLYQLLRSGLCA